MVPVPINTGVSILLNERISNDTQASILKLKDEIRGFYERLATNMTPGYYLPFRVTMKEPTQ